ncbi:hypothetical protein ACIPY2_11660 [Paenarthrobacter sp. NPDC089675]|uniref:hypothetical protein n=1 Tax=Paenarthrobacter sp. NPDC089675 TaxID=3364376 RepID=UPI003821DD22
MAKSLKTTRPFALLVVAACALSSVSACSNGDQGPSERRHIADNFSDLVVQALRDPTLQEFDRNVLARAKESGRIEQADYDEAYGRFAQCMAAAGRPVRLTKLNNGLYRVENTPLADGETLESAFSAVTNCQRGTTNEIGELFGIQQGNPELLADADQVAYNCLAAKGMVGSAFSKDDLKKALDDKENDKTSLEDRLPFDPYADEAQACFVGANIVIGKGASQR